MYSLIKNVTMILFIIVLLQILLEEFIYLPLFIFACGKENDLGIILYKDFTYLVVLKYVLVNNPCLANTHQEMINHSIRTL